MTTPTIAFDPVVFRALFPPYADPVKFPDVLLNLMFGSATAYISDEIAYPFSYCIGLNLAQQTLALNYMTAHLLALQDIINAGNTPGIETSASVDKISVSMQPPPMKDAWEYWMNLTPYGAALLALLSVAAAGGFYFGGGGMSPKLQFRQ